MDIASFSQQNISHSKKPGEARHSNNPAAQSQFQDLLQDKVDTILPQAIQAADESHKLKQKDDKRMSQIHSTEDEEEEESLENTVQKIKDKILALAELERRGRGL